MNNAIGDSDSFPNPCRANILPVLGSYTRGLSPLSKTVHQVTTSSMQLYLRLIFMLVLSPLLFLTVFVFFSVSGLFPILF